MAQENLPPIIPMTNGRTSEIEWAEFFSAFSHIIFVANSNEQRFEELQAQYPDTALFVFFNRVHKVLSQPFNGNALLVTRSNQAGSQLIYRGMLSEMVGYFPTRFSGVMNVRMVDFERLNVAGDFGTVPVGFFDMAGYFENFYPADHTPSTGFALALWLCEKVPGPNVVLTGFSAKRGTWKILHVHDWTFEQTALNLLANTGKLTIAGDVQRNAYAALLARFPDIGSQDIAFAAIQTLSLRAESSNIQIDKLISLTIPLRAVSDFLRRFKPKTRKQKALARREKAPGKNV